MSHLRRSAGVRPISRTVSHRRSRTVSSRSHSSSRRGVKSAFPTNKEARAQRVAGQRTLHLAAPRPRNDEEALASARSQERSGRARAHRVAACGAGKGAAREGSPRRVRERVPRLLRRARHVLRRDAQRRRPRVSADVLDTYSKVGFAKLYTEKTPVTAADTLNDRVLPFFEEQGVPLVRMLTDRGSEFCGRPESHPYELYLAIEDIDHTRTKVKSPQTNGNVERFHKTVLNEFYRNAFRKKHLRIARSAANRSRPVDARVQLRSPAPGAMVLREDTHANVHRYGPACQREATGGIATDTMSLTNPGEESLSVRWRPSLYT